MALSMPNMGGANANGLWCATLATFGLGLQAFVGTNLQAPGAYRPVLRRWHTTLFWTIAIAAAAHVALNG